VLPGDLHQQRDVRPVGLELGAQGAEGVLAPEDLQDLLVELRSRGRVRVDPVDLLPVPVEEEDEGRSLDLEPLVDLIADLGAAGGAVKDEVVFDELLVGGIGIILLNQQLAGPSAAFLEEIEEQKPVLGLRLGQGIVD
jgi:hypothetical protein